MKEAQRVQKLIERLKKAYPDAKCSLHFRNPYELFVATVLSAQCTDKRVNMVTPEFFREIPTVKKLATASRKRLEELIASTGFFRQKAKALQEAAQKICEQYGGNLPQTLSELTTLPGVGRKTANVILGNAFGKAEGVVVDTHVKRISYRLGLTKHTHIRKIEMDLERQVPNKDWEIFPHLVIHHGREICRARNPLCNKCSLRDLCPQKGVRLSSTPPSGSRNAKAPSQAAVRGDSLRASKHKKR